MNEDMEEKLKESYEQAKNIMKNQNKEVYIEEELEKLYEQRKNIRKQIDYITSGRAYESYINTGMEPQRTEEGNSIVSDLHDLYNELNSINKEILSLEIQILHFKGKTEEAETKQKEFDEKYGTKKDLQ